MKKALMTCALLLAMTGCNEITMDGINEAIAKCENNDGIQIIRADFLDTVVVTCNNNAHFQFN